MCVFPLDLCRRCPFQCEQPPPFGWFYLGFLSHAITLGLTMYPSYPPASASRVHLNALNTPLNTLFDLSVLCLCSPSPCRLFGHLLQGNPATPGPGLQGKGGSHGPLTLGCPSLIGPQACPSESTILDIPNTRVLSPR